MNHQISTIFLLILLLVIWPFFTLRAEEGTLIGSREYIAGANPSGGVTCLVHSGSGGEFRWFRKSGLALCRVTDSVWAAFSMMSSDEQARFLWRSGEQISSDRGITRTLSSGSNEMYLSNQGVVFGLMNAREPGQPEVLSLWAFTPSFEGAVSKTMLAEIGTEVSIGGYAGTLTDISFDGAGPRNAAYRFWIDSQQVVVIVDSVDLTMRVFPDDFEVSNPFPSASGFSTPHTYSFPSGAELTLYHTDSSSRDFFHHFYSGVESSVRLQDIHPDSNLSLQQATISAAVPRAELFGQGQRATYFLPRNEDDLSLGWYTWLLEEPDAILAPWGLSYETSCFFPGYWPVPTTYPSGIALFEFESCVSPTNEQVQTLIQTSANRPPKILLAKYMPLDFANSSEVREIHRVSETPFGIKAWIETFDGEQLIIDVDLCSGAVSLSEEQTFPLPSQQVHRIENVGDEIVYHIEDVHGRCLSAQYIFADQFES